MWFSSRLAAGLLVGGCALTQGMPLQAEPGPQGRGRQPGAAQILPRNDDPQGPAARGRGPGRAGANAGQLIDRLSRMKPEDRERALANLPPARREALMKRLDQLEMMPPGARILSRLQVERLESLPQEKRSEVRKALRQFQALPERRKMMLGNALERLRALPEEERQSRLETNPFQNRFTGTELRMLGSLLEILPPQ